MWGAASPDASLRSGCRNRSGLTSGNSTEDLAGGLELEKGRRAGGGGTSDKALLPASARPSVGNRREEVLPTLPPS